MTTDNVKNNYNKKIAWYNIKFNTETFIHIFCFLSVLFIGADIIGINVGINFRLDQIFLTILAVLMVCQGKYKITKCSWIFLFILSSGISTLLAYNISRAILYLFSIVYNVFFVFYVFANYVKFYGIKKIIDIFRKTCYVEFVIFILQYVLKVLFNFEFSFLPTYGFVMGIPRFRLWFYEPSYLATYLLIWFSLSFFMLLIRKDIGYIIDFIISLVMLLLCTSSTGYVGIILSVALIFLIWLKRGITIKKLIFPVIALLIALILYIVFKDILDFFLLRIFSGDLDSASGGRITHWAETYQVFKDNPFFGVGPGNYGLYLGEDTGYVPSNVTLEIMATLGIFATIFYYGLTLSLIYRSFKISKRNKSYECSLLCALAVALFIFTIILQVNQGYLRLYHWMLFGIIYGGIEKYGKSKVHTQNKFKYVFENS